MGRVHMRDLFAGYSNFEILFTARIL
jgi:hypothetical protein